MLLTVLFTDADITGGSFMACLGVAGSMASVAVSEELLFRGVVHRILEQRTGSIVAIAVSSLIFGLTHAVNSNATRWGTMAIAVEGGARLAIAYTATRSLWLPIGLHFAWNFTESGMFGTAVSGADSEPGWYVVRCCSAATNASRTECRSMTTSPGSLAVRIRESGIGSTKRSPDRGAPNGSPTAAVGPISMESALRWAPRNMSTHTWWVMRCTQVESRLRLGSNRSRLRHARINVSWTASSVSPEAPSMR